MKKLQSRSIVIQLWNKLDIILDLTLENGKVQVSISYDHDSLPVGMTHDDVQKEVAVVLERGLDDI